VEKLNGIWHRKPEIVLSQGKDDKSVANMFSSFFTNKITQIHNSFRNQSFLPISPDISSTKLERFSLTTQESNPTKCCLLLPQNRACLTPDQPIWLNNFLPSITKSVNSSLVEGFVPSSWKQAVINKTSLSKDELKNYRSLELSVILVCLEWSGLGLVRFLPDGHKSMR